MDSKIKELREAAKRQIETVLSNPGTCREWINGCLWACEKAGAITEDEKLIALSAVREAGEGAKDWWEE